MGLFPLALLQVTNSRAERHADFLAEPPRGGTTPRSPHSLAAVELVLSPEQMQRLDELSTPVLAFPASMAAIVPGFAYAGTTINGVSGPISPWVPQKDAARY